MNDAALKLHTVARRYCIQRHHRWTTKYGYDSAKWSHTEAQGIYPRYNVLKAILEEVERYDPSQFAGLGEARKAISAAGHRAQSVFTQPPNSRIAQQAMQEERQAFCRFVETFHDADLDTIEPLQYRRVLTSDESAEVWSQLASLWGLSKKEEYWYPLENTVREDVMAVDASSFNNLDPKQLQAILEQHGVHRLWELREYGTEYEMDLALFNPYYNGAEGYWTSHPMDWIIYASHESSITFGGIWLIEEIKGMWPSWREHLWTIDS